MAVKVHADELTAQRASEVFIRAKARSVDHLQKVSSAAIALLGESSTVATLLPATSFYLGLEFAPARALLQAGARVALASDYNPGTAPMMGLQLSMLLAAQSLRMTPPEILCACTYNGAAALGLEGALGALAQGFCADILLWQAPNAPGPDGVGVLEDIVTSYGQPAMVLTRGQMWVSLSADSFARSGGTGEQVAGRKGRRRASS